MGYLTVTRKTPLLTAILYDGTAESFNDICNLAREASNADHSLRVAKADFDDCIYIVDNTVRHYVSVYPGNAVIYGEWSENRLVVMTEKEFNDTYDIVDNIENVEF